MKNNLDLEYINKLGETHINNLYKDIVEELIEDAHYIANYYSLTNADKSELLLMGTELIGKYCFIVYLLEKEEEYEKCAEILKHIRAVVNEFIPLTKQEIEESIQLSLQLYNNNLNDLEI